MNRPLVRISFLSFFFFTNWIYGINVAVVVHLSRVIVIQKKGKIISRNLKLHPVVWRWLHTGKGFFRIVS
jgi:hypothetical protein